MAAKARITTDFPTPNEVASRLRIPAARRAELRRQLFDLHITNPDGSVVVVRPKTVAARAAARSKKK